MTPAKLRSRAWFDNPSNADMTALYLERTMNYGLSFDELQSGRPIIGIAQSGSDISPCNRHHIVLAERVREGVRDAGGIVLEFPIHPIQETCKRPTAALDRNLQYLSLVEMLYGYPIDGVVLTTGCDKTTPGADHGRRHGGHSRPSRSTRGRCSTAGSRASAPAPAPSSGKRAS